MSETSEQLETWSYLRSYYYPRFVNGITRLNWSNRFDVLKMIHGDWEDRSEDPINAMIEYVKENNGYFEFFCKGVEVFEDGSFKLKHLISAHLGNIGICDDF